MRNLEKMTIHKALSELKIIDDRIDKAIDGAEFVTANRHSNTKLNGVPIAQWTETAKSQNQSIDDLIKRRDMLKRAVVLSNAVTTVSVGGNEYTVAEAIEMKQSGIKKKQKKLQAMQMRFHLAVNACARENETLASKADEHIVRIYGAKEVKNLTDDMTRSRNEYITQNTVELIDPLNILDIITTLEAEIAAFLVDVDSVLSVSNALTHIGE